MTQPLKLVAITGPTASGKTALAVKLARRFNGEIISVDSRQVFRGMNLGTGKDLEEYQEVPYHLIDVADPAEIYHLKRFMDDSAVALKTINEHGSLPLLCGGTALYLDAVLRNYELKGGEPDFTRRAEIRDLPSTELAARLLKLAPELYGSLQSHELKNQERLLRLLERARNHEMATDNELFDQYRKLVIGVYFTRSEIRKRIETRLDRRLAAGMIEEVADLHEKCGVSWERLEMFGLEYRAIAEYLQKKISFDDMRSSLLNRIRQFAKRQDIWFRKMERSGIVIHWIVNGNFEQSAALVDDFLHDRPLPEPEIRLDDIRYG
ncbi:MAG: tRNA (adenosine(37)-N6)-dimethylallyltransferase MiaA [Victivallaceae bacterium]|nr:tRNA (adenosine(37)-N6)-dimethylallyltransferase MiaA [Victivallaceae bacterium]MDD3703444.1 tRNA (adenosine(37)-N6)-dimethylallyltransferase MiaA [Victivallaceae bacterium]MDD5663470.1 tRNA (adenosine(37)-N6)-dimethylallyltransferase MiaA [Victivallaceae bacterium]